MFPYSPIAINTTPNMTKKSELSLVNFFAFNSSYGPKEGEEHKKILYYYPPETDIDVKIKEVGLCEAVVQFTKTFTTDDPDAIHTQKTRQLFYEAEPEYWVVMTVKIPCTEKTKDGKVYEEYHEEEVQDTVYKAILQQAYKMFRFFNGSFCSIVERSSVESLKQRLQHFYSKYFVLMRLNHADVLDIFHGIHFLPLDKNTYLRIQCFINLLEANFPHITYTAFLYNDQLVWSGLEQEDMRIMYKYLSTALFPKHMEQEFASMHSMPSTSSTAAVPVGNAHYGKFILGPPTLGADEKDMGKIPRVYVNSRTPDSAQQGECNLLVYKALSATVCLLVDSGHTLTFDYFRKLDKFLGVQMSCLASDISEQYARKTVPSSDAQFKYIYFNHMNLAQKTTVHTDGKKTTNINVTPDILQVIADLNADLNHPLASTDGETIVKTSTDCWVVSKKSDQREFYVVLNQKHANLIEINEEVKKMVSSAFSNIFFLD